MTQVIDRQSGSGTGVALSTLADDTTATVVSRFTTAIKERFVLFEVMAQFLLINVELSEMLGINILLVDGDISDAALATLLATTIQKDAPENVALAQRLKAVAELDGFIEDTQSSGSSTGKISYTMKLHFKAPKGVPYEEDNGFKVVAFNRTGSALTTGALVGVTRMKTRYAYVR